MEKMITKADLDTRICDFYGQGDNEETFREYIRSSEDYFGMHEENLDDIFDEDLQEYIDFLDELWGK